MSLYRDLWCLLQRYGIIMTNHSIPIDGLLLHMQLKYRSVCCDITAELIKMPFTVFTQVDSMNMYYKGSLPTSGRYIFHGILFHSNEMPTNR